MAPTQPSFSIPWRSSLLLLLGLAFLGTACRLTDVPLYSPVPQAAHAYEVERVRDIPYYAGTDADPVRHRLDLYLPRGQKNYPVVLLVHGGGWVMGDKRLCGLVSSVAEFLASQGIGTVVPNYRLSPAVRHPEHIKDVARAFAWTHACIAEHGGCAEQIFLMGHSAGGHLVSLLATDESYLKAEGLKSEDVRGVVALSGVYRLPPARVLVTLGGTSARSFRFDELTPLRGESGRSAIPRTLLPGIPVCVDVYGPPFGDDPLLREDASPVVHVRRGLPPFLILVSERDLPTLPEQAEEFHEALRDRGGEAQLLRIPARNHNSILFRAIDRDDPVAGMVLEFVRRHAGQPPAPCEGPAKGSVRGARP